MCTSSAYAHVFLRYAENVNEQLNRHACFEQNVAGIKVLASCELVSHGSRFMTRVEDGVSRSGIFTLFACNICPPLRHVDTDAVL